MELTDFSPSSALVTVILLALAPFAVVMLTSFAKIVVILSLLRNALGVQQVPPNLVLNGLALVLTLYVMYPVGQLMLEQVQDVDDVLTDTEQFASAASRAGEPLRAFLLKHAPEEERLYFHETLQEMVGEDRRSELGTEDFIVVIPAFTVAELTSAFQIGFLIFLPFIIIDLVIANVLMAMGMMMLSPTIISLPFKLLLFVLIDGWARLAQGLVQSYL